MKALCKIFVIVVLIFFFMRGIQAQTQQTNLNQIELLQQFIGSWKVDIAIDTTCFWEVRLFGSGLEGNIKYLTKGKTINEGKQLLGYDKNTDKFIDAELIKGKGINIFTLWFKSKNKCVIYFYSDISNPERATFKEELEFKTPDLFLETIKINNKPDKTYAFTRIKINE
jgi:hypothetical protein